MTVRSKTILTTGKGQFWKQTRCKKCGAFWNHWIYARRGGSNCRIYWNRTGKMFSPMDNKPIPSFRVILVDGKWKKHPNPAWKDTKPLKRCC